MKNFLIAFLVFLIWSFFGLWLYSWLQPIENNSINQDSIATTKADDITLKIDDPLPIDESTAVIGETPDSLSLKENEDDLLIETAASFGLKATTPNNDLVFLFSEGISIWKNTDQLQYSNKIMDFKYKLNTYLVEHPDEELHISSLYSASENIVNPNFGYQRGQKLKRILLKIGIEGERMVVKPVIREIAFDKNGVYKNGIFFTFQPLNSKRVDDLRHSLPETKTIYPKLVNNDIFVNVALQDLLTEVKNALEANPNLQVHIVGHTDNIGNANDNYKLGLKYARQVRWYLITNGNIKRDRIIASSEGESKAIASNKTERGRLLNRRIEVRYRTN
jgi:OmpA-OmpF porin, OOP family